MSAPHTHRLRWLTLSVLAACSALVAGPVLARIRVGIEGVDGAVRRNVLALLSVERYKDRERIEPDAVNRLFRRVDDEVRSALRPFGYYDPNISTELTPEDKDRDWRVQIRIDTGPPVLIATVDVVVRGPGAEDEVFRNITAAPGMRPGDRLEHAAYEQLKGNLQRAAATFGYLDARMQRSELAVDTLQHRASIHLELDTGERYRFGATTIQQEAVRAGRIRRFLRYQEGEPYDAGKLLRTQFALDDSQYFSTVEVLPGERDSATHTVPITITTARARRTYSLGAGYGTDTGVRGTFSWLNPRMNTLGHRLRVQVQASQITQTFDVRYDVPFGDPALEKLSLNLTREQQQISDGIDIVENSIKPSITQVRGRWQRVFSLAAVHTVTTDAVIRPHRRRPHRPRHHLRVGARGLPGRGAVLAHAVRRAAGLAQRPGLECQFPASRHPERTRARSAGELAPAAARGVRHQRHRQLRRAAGAVPLLRRRRPQRARLRL